MKRFTEPIIGFLTAVSTFEAWSNFLLSLILAFLGGALGFLGKYLVQRAISKFNNRKNKTL